MLRVLLNGRSLTRAVEKTGITTTTNRFYGAREPFNKSRYVAHNTFDGKDGKDGKKMKESNVSKFQGRDQQQQQQQHQQKKKANNDEDTQVTKDKKVFTENGLVVKKETVKSKTVKVEKQNLKDNFTTKETIKIVSKKKITKKPKKDSILAEGVEKAEKIEKIEKVDDDIDDSDDESEDDSTDSDEDSDSDDTSDSDSDDSDEESEDEKEGKKEKDEEIEEDEEKDIKKETASIKILHFEVDDLKKELTVTWADGFSSKFHYIWLKDHSPSSMDPSSGQKLHSAANIPLDTSPEKISNDDNAITINWDQTISSTFTSQWLRENYYPNSFKTKYPSTSKPILWRATDFESKYPFPEMNYNSFTKSSSQVKKCFENLHKYGIMYLRNVPQNHTEIEKVALKFGLIQETFYGRTWDVKSVPNAQNIAYTSLPLHFHQDLLYFESPPGLQFLHSLKNSTAGGETTFLDGFLAAEILKDQDPAAFEILTKVPVTFHYNRGNHHYHFRHKTISLDGENEYLNINYSPQFQGVLNIEHDMVLPFYESYQKFSKILSDPSLVLASRLAPGDLVIFNNRRLLHARNRFYSNKGERHLKGTYVLMDEFRSKWRVLQ